MKGVGVGDSVGDAWPCDAYGSLMRRNAHCPQRSQKCPHSAPTYLPSTPNPLFPPCPSSLTGSRACCRPMQGGAACPGHRAWAACPLASHLPPWEESNGPRILSSSCQNNRLLTTSSTDILAETFHGLLVLCSKLAGDKWGWCKKRVL